MASCFEEGDPRGYGDVEAVDFASGGHGDGDEKITMLPSEPAEACALGSHDDAKGTFQIGLVDGLLGSVRGAD